jgi:hypothetical protein
MFRNSPNAISALIPGSPAFPHRNPDCLPIR